MRRIFTFTIIILLALAPAAPAHAKKSMQPQDVTLIPAIKPIVATYDVYVGGIHLLTADVLFQEGAAKYRAQVKGQTYGLLYKVFPWNTELDAQGQIKDDHFVPVEYTTHDLWGKKAKSTKMTFVKGDVKTEYDPPETDTSPDKMTAAQKQGALDPVTALLQMLAHVAIDQNCDVTVPVLDGKRRFDITGTDRGMDVIDETDYGVYSGAARLCDAKFTAVAGEWTEKIKQKFWKKAENGEDREPFHIWLTKISPDLPEMAVRIETGTVWGDVVVHLTKWRPAGVADGVIPMETPVLKHGKATREAAVN